MSSATNVTVPRRKISNSGVLRSKIDPKSGIPLRYPGSGDEISRSPGTASDRKDCLSCKPRQHVAHGRFGAPRSYRLRVISIALPFALSHPPWTKRWRLARQGRPSATRAGRRSARPSTGSLMCRPGDDCACGYRGPRRRRRRSVASWAGRARHRRGERCSTSPQPRVGAVLRSVTCRPGNLP
jgi:hypothetical protein